MARVPKGIYTAFGMPLKGKGKIRPVSDVPKDYLWHTWGEAAYGGKFILRRRSWKWGSERSSWSTVQVYSKSEITVQERLDGAIPLVFASRRLHFHLLPGWPDGPEILNLQATRDQPLEISTSPRYRTLRGSGRANCQR